MAEWIVSADSRKIMKQLVLDAHLSPKDLSGIDDILEKNRVNFQDLKNLKKKLPNNVPICVFLEKLKLHFEPQEYTASLEFKAKTESLRQKQSQYEYKKIVQSVDPTQKYGKINHMENFGAEMKTVNRQVMSVVNVLITVVGAFFFGFSGVTYAYPHLKLDLATRFIIGLVPATIVFFADLYFIIKNLSFDDMPEEKQPYQTFSFKNMETKKNS